MSSAEALRDVLRFLNMHDFRRDDEKYQHDDSGHRSKNEERPLAIHDNAIVVYYANMRLGTGFQTIIARDGATIGYKALTTATFNALTRQSGFDVSKLTPNAGDRREIIYLDRLTRTLHALNYLAQGLSGALHLSVNPRHLLEVHDNHGEVFAQILAKCGLHPNRIVLEIAEYAVRDKQHLTVAVAGWQKRHYRIAFDGFGTENTPLTNVLKLRPDAIKFDSDFVMRSIATPALQKRFIAILDEIHRAGIATIATQINSAALHNAVKSFSFTALQGNWVDYVSDALEQKTA